MVTMESMTSVSKAVRRQILHCAREGWNVANTASIVKVSPRVVRQVLMEEGLKC